MSDSGPSNLPPGFRPAHLPDELPHVGGPESPSTSPSPARPVKRTSTHAVPDPVPAKAAPHEPRPTVKPTDETAPAPATADPTGLPPGFDPVPVDARAASEHDTTNGTRPTARPAGRTSAVASTSPFGLAVPVGGLLAIAGAIQTWSTGKIGRKKVSYNGFAHGHHGVLVVLFGIALLAAGFVLVRIGRNMVASAGAALLGAVLAVVAVVDLADIANHSDGFAAAATVGPGLPIALLGGVIAIAGGVGTLLGK